MTKYTTKKILSVILAVASVMFCIPVYASGEFTQGDCTYTVSDGEATIIGFSSLISGDIIIPDTLGDCPVTHIGDDAFSWCKDITSITLPDSIIHIGKRAFYGCGSLREIDIPHGVTSINDETFYSCSSLTSVTIPDSVIHIGSNAFTWSGIATITISDSVTSLGNNAFSGCYSLVNVTVGCGVSTIPDWAFSNCDSLRKIIIPKSVTSITSDAFFNCPSLSEVYYGGSRMDWDNIAIASTNSYLTSANEIHFNCDTTNPGEHFVYTVITEPTCSAEGTAAYVCPCGFSKYEETLPTTDNHVNSEIRDSAEPTFSADGYSGDTYCTDCGTLLAEGEVIPKLPAPPVSPGDANGDGTINLSDVTLLLQYIAKWDVTLG